MGFVQSDMLDMTLTIQEHLTGNMKSIPNHTQHAQALPGRMDCGQVMANPTNEVVSQLAQQDKHFLGGETRLITLGDAQSLFTAPVPLC